MTPQAISLSRRTRAAIITVFESLQYDALGRMYCDAGGAAFWQERRGPCERLGVRLARVLQGRLTPGGRSLYVGAGVAELPILIMERLELNREVAAFNLRREEVRVLNTACRAASVPLRIAAGTAARGRGRFDHVWIVSVLNDPERYPELSALAYGRANPAKFQTARFERERRAVRALAAATLAKLGRPGLVTTSVEEIPWITDWCDRHGIRAVVEQEDYPTAIVGDPVCFIRIGGGRGR